MTRARHPSDVAGLLSESEIEEATKAVKRLRGRDQARFDVARDTFDDGTSR